MMRRRYNCEGTIKNFQGYNGKDDVEEIAHDFYELILEELVEAHAKGIENLKLFIKIKY